MNWVQDYVPVGEMSLTEDEYERLFKDFPYAPRSVRDCPTCQGTKKYVWKGEERQCNCEEQTFLHRQYLVAGIGELYQRLSWDDYVGNATAKKQAIDYVEMHRQMYRSGLGLFFASKGWGTGKTLLANLVAKELVRLGYSVYGTTFAMMIEQFTKGWADKAQQEWFEQKVMLSQFLVLDDVGKEFVTKTNLRESTFDVVLRTRVANLLPTIMTTNLEEDKIAVGYGGGVLSLLRERSVMSKVDGEDWRLSAKRRAFTEADSGETRPIF